jgi:3-deoxy-D-manno-octulosonic-acid transferase
MFGPRHEKFKEAVELIKEKGALTFDSSVQFSDILDKWLADEPFYLKSANAASFYVTKNKGATDKIIKEISSKDINRLRS